MSVSKKQKKSSRLKKKQINIDSINKCHKNRQSTTKLTPSSGEIELTLQLSKLESLRTSKRTMIESLYESFQSIRSQMSQMQEELQKLDDEIQSVEEKRKSFCGEIAGGARVYAESLTQMAGHILSNKGSTDERKEHEQRNGLNTSNLSIVEEKNQCGKNGEGPSKNDTLTLNPDEHLTEPTQNEYHNYNDEYIEENIEDHYTERPPPFLNQVNKSNCSVGQEMEIPEDVEFDEYIVPDMEPKLGKGGKEGIGELDFVSTSTSSFGRILRASTPAGLQTTGITIIDSTTSQNPTNSTKNSFFNRKSLSSTSAIIPVLDPQHNEISSSSTSSIFPPSLQQQFNNELSTNTYNRTKGTYPWTKHVYSSLRNTFKIRAFRDHQEKIINATLSQEDVFVIMRTGGGKSLTYQLPALLEGMSPSHKVTLVISPLLSLIRDQEDQMNAFCKGSATSFTSGIEGGVSEHAQRWNRVRDPHGGICLIFVTPEKVSKSNKLRAEVGISFLFGGV